MTDDLPREVYGADMELLGVKIRVVVLDNGQRLIEGDGLGLLLEALNGKPFTEQEAADLMAVINEAGA